MGRGNFSRPTLLFAYFGDFSLRMRSCDHTTSGLKFDGFDDNVCVCAVGALILLQVTI